MLKQLELKTREARLVNPIKIIVETEEWVRKVEKGLLSNAEKGHSTCRITFGTTENSGTPHGFKTWVDDAKIQIGKLKQPDKTALIRAIQEIREAFVVYVAEFWELYSDVPVQVVNGCHLVFDWSQRAPPPKKRIKVW